MKNIKNIKTIWLLYLLLLIGVASNFKAQAQVEDLELNNFRSGKLDNGFSYFIKDLKETQNKIALKFYVKVGNLQENTGQLQVAHLIEHLAFKPTKNFPNGINNSILNLEMVPRDLGGTTGYKSTRYSFDAPAKNSKAIHLGLKWFKDIALNLDTSDKNINQERGAVRQEFIYGELGNLNTQYAQMNLEAQLFPCYHSFDNFLKHIITFPGRNLRRFYKDWYRPDLMGVMIVGNIESIDKLEQLIKSIFNGIPIHKNPRNKINCDSLYFARFSQFKKVELKENEMSGSTNPVEFRFYFRQLKLTENKSTAEGYKQKIAFQILLNIISKRFSIDNKSNPSLNILVKQTVDRDKPLLYSLALKIKEMSVEKAFRYVFQRLHQFRKYGVIDKEWNAIKMKYLENWVKEDAKYWHQQLWDYFVKGEALFKNKQQIVHQWVKNLSAEEFNAITKKFLHSMPDDIGIIAPTGSNALQYTEKQVRSWIKEANRLPVIPYQLPRKTEQLMTSKEINKLNKVDFKDHGRQPNGTREIVLENGIKVMLKPYQPTKGVLQNKIKLHGFSPMGAVCFAGEDYYSALNIPSFIKFNGIGRYSNPQVKSFMKANNIDNCTPYIGYKNSGIHALTGRSNVEEMLQLVYLYFTEPKMEKQRFEGWKKLKHKIYKRQNDATHDFNKNIRYYFQDSILPYAYGGHRFLKPIEAFESIKKTDMKRGFEIYQQIFGNPQEFTFVITGSFDINHISLLIQKYLGNIPQLSSLRNCDGQNRLYKPNHSGPIYKTFITNRYQMESVKYDLRFVKANCKNKLWKESLKVQVLGELTNIMLMRLRTQNGFALYNFGASGGYNADKSIHKINFDITCQAKELKAIQQECQKIIEEIKKGEIKKMDFIQASKRIQNRYAQQNILRQRSIQKLLFEQLRYDKPWVELEKYEKFILSIDIQDMVEVANEYFQKKYRYEFVMNDKPL